EIGETIAVGSEIVKIEIAGSTSAPMDDGEGDAPIADGTAPQGETLPAPPAEKIETAKPAPSKAEQPKPAATSTFVAASVGAPRAEGERPLASPAVRLRAKEMGLDL